MTIEQMQEAFMYDSDLVTHDEAVELLAEMFDEQYEITSEDIRSVLGLKERIDG